MRHPNTYFEQSVWFCFLRIQQAIKLQFCVFRSNENMAQIRLERNCSCTFVGVKRKLAEQSNQAKQATSPLCVVTLVLSFVFLPLIQTHVSIYFLVCFLFLCFATVLIRLFVFSFPVPNMHAPRLQQRRDPDTLHHR